MHIQAWSSRLCACMIGDNRQTLEVATYAVEPPAVCPGWVDSLPFPPDPEVQASAGSHGDDGGVRRAELRGVAGASPRRAAVPEPPEPRRADLGEHRAPARGGPRHAPRGRGRHRHVGRDRRAATGGPAAPAGGAPLPPQTPRPPPTSVCV